MSIAVALPDDFEIEDYDGLRTFLIDHLQLDTGTQAQLANLIRLAELRLRRKIVTPGREETATLTTTAGTQTVALPSDFTQMQQARIAGDSGAGYPLPQVALDVVEEYDSAGKPVVYAIHDSSLVLGPIPDAAYTINLRYIEDLTALTYNSRTNWVLTQHADAYVYMAAAVINLHLENKEAANLYLGLADEVIREINEQGVRHSNSGPMRPSVVTVP